MATIKLTVKSDFSGAQKDIKAIGTLTEKEAKRIEKFTKSFKTEQIDSFIQKNQRAAAAVKATQGPLAAAQTKTAGLQKKIQTLIRNGLDPEDAAVKKLRIEYDKATRELNENVKAHEKVNKVTALNAAAFLYLGKQVLNAGKRIVDFGMRLVDTYAIQEQAEVSLANSIEATGRQSEISLSELKDYASGLQELTRFGDEATLSSMGLLQSLADLDQKGLEEVTPAVMDLATKAMGGNLETAMNMVGKTLGSSTNALSRYGIQIDMSGTKAEKLAELTENLTSKFGGAAAAAAEAATGALPQMQNAWGDLQEANGQWIINAAEPTIRKLTEIITGFADAKTRMNEYQEALRALRGGTLGEFGLDELQAQLQAAKDELAEINKNQGIATAGRAVKVQELVAALENEIATKKMILRYDSQAAETAKARAAAEAADVERQASLNEYLKLVADTYAQTEQGKLESLEKEIALWQEYAATANKTAPQIAAILEELEAKHRSMTESEEENLSDRLAVLHNAEAQANQERLTTYGEFLAARMEQEDVALEGRIAFLETERERILSLDNLTGEERIAAEQAIADRILTIEQNLSDAKQAIKEKELSTYAGFFGALSDLASTAGEENKAMVYMTQALAAAEAAINSYLAFTQVLADPFYTGRPWMRAIAAGTVLASGLAAQANIIGTAVNAESGGSFVIPENPASSRGDSQTMRVNPGEEVDVTPRGESSRKSLTVNTYFDKSLLWSITQEGFDSGEINVTTDNIKAG